MPKPDTLRVQGANCTLSRYAVLSRLQLVSKFQLVMKRVLEPAG